MQSYHADNPRYSFRTGKVGVPGGVASALALAVALEVYPWREPVANLLFL